MKNDIVAPWATHFLVGETVILLRRVNHPQYTCGEDMPAYQDPGALGKVVKASYNPGIDNLVLVIDGIPYSCPDDRAYVTRAGRRAVTKLDE